MALYGPRQIIALETDRKTEANELPSLELTVWFLVFGINTCNKLSTSQWGDLCSSLTVAACAVCSVEGGGVSNLLCLELVSFLTEHVCRQFYLV